jgi:hypothetical protein
LILFQDIAFGKPLGNLQADQDYPSFIKTVEKTSLLIVLLATFPGLAQLFSFGAFKGFRPKNTDPIGLGKLMGYLSLQVITYTVDWSNTNSISNEMVEERFGNKKIRRDMLGSFIRHSLTKREE